MKRTSEESGLARGPRLQIQMLPGMAPESLFKQKLPNYEIGLRFRVSGLGVLELGAFREFWGKCGWFQISFTPGRYFERVEAKEEVAVMQLPELRNLLRVFKFSD